MAGKSDKLLSRLVCAVILLAVAVTSAAAERVRGRSRDLGVDFEIQGGEQWCATNITILLNSENPSVYQPDGMPFLQMIGRIRAVVNDQCPSVERMLIEGRTQGKKVFVAEMTRLTQWRRLIALDPQTMQPLCTAPAQSATHLECDKRIAAYTTVTQLMRGPAFANVEITSFLEDRTDLHLAWQDDGAFGAVKISHRSEYDNQYTTNAAFADANMQAVDQACVNDHGKPESIPAGDYGAALAFRSTLCRRTSAPTRVNILMVASQGDWFYLFSLWGEEPHMAAANKMASALAEAMSGKP